MRLHLQPGENGSHEKKSVDPRGDFLNSEAVQAAFDEAKTDDRASVRYVRGVIASLLQPKGAVTYDEIAANLGIASTSHVGHTGATLATAVLPKWRATSLSR